MMLGREVNQPIDLLFPMKPASDVSHNQHVAELQVSLKLAHETARKYLQTSQERMKSDNDLKVYTRVYDKGDLVYILDTATIKGQTKKLGHFWIGWLVVLGLTAL